MKKHFESLKEMYRRKVGRSISLQQRLMFYFFAIISVIICIMLAVCSVTDVFSLSEKELNRGLSTVLDRSSSELLREFDRTNAYCIKLSDKISTEIEYALKKDNLSFENLNDNPQIIRDIEQSVYNLLGTVLETSQCSGVYAVMDVTVNTEGENAESSRCGVYLRRTSVNDINPVNAGTALFRGMKEVARKNKIELHNRWNMELDIDKLPYYTEMKNSSPLRATDSYLWARKESLSGTWEKAMMLVVPVIGSGGEFYGICGVEISELYFRLAYPSSESKFGNVVTVLSPRENEYLHLEDGLCGNDNRGKFTEQTLCIKQGDYFDYYTSGERRYVGLSSDISISSSPLDGTEWEVTVLLPASNFREYAAKRKALLISAFALILIILILMSVFLSRRYVKPITNQLKAIQSGSPSHEEATGLSEIDELMNYLKSQNKSNITNDIPEGLREIFDGFIERAGTLTNAEYNILEYYIEGYQIMEIPDLAYISMSTVRRHNRSIYEKLGVASRDELMLYINLLKSCGRLDELRRKAKA